MSPVEFIVDAEKIISRFGKWPHFHDMETICLHMDRRGGNEPWIEFVVFAWDYSGRITSDGFYEQILHSLIRFRCERVGSNQFFDFNHQNVLDGLEFSRTTGDSEEVTVHLPSIYGLGGALSCGLVRVVDVIPATPKGEPA